MEDVTRLRDDEIEIEERLDAALEHDQYGALVLSPFRSFFSAPQVVLMRAPVLLICTKFSGRCVAHLCSLGDLSSVLVSCHQKWWTRRIYF